MKSKLILGFLFIAATSIAQSQYSEISSQPGAFSRMGFGARGKGMANAMSAVTRGDLVSYYNPALSVFQEGNSFQTSYSFLSLDRSLNFLNFTRKFEFGMKNPDGTARTKPRSVAGISIGLINASVGDFKERDNQGLVVGDLEPFENQFFLGLAIRFSEKLAIGFNSKFYYSKLYDDVTSTSLGFDLGALYRFNEFLSLSFVLTDINSKYKWDTTTLYGQEGSTEPESFPVLMKIGASYYFENEKLLTSIEFESSNADTKFLRIGAEYNIFESLYVRAGVDRFNLSNTDYPVRPAIGFSYDHTFNSLVAGFDYAFVVEPYSAYDQHIIGISINF